MSNSNAAFYRQQSSASIFYEQIVQEYQREELAQLATLDKIAQGGKDGKKKKESGGFGAAVSSTEKIRTWKEHMIELEDLANQLETKIYNDPPGHGFHGLTKVQADSKLLKYGRNELTEKKQLPVILKFLLMMTGLFNYMLWIGSALCFICYGIQTTFTDKSNLYLACVLIGVIIITAIFNFQQESKASAIMAQFKDFIPKEAVVWREGKQQKIQASELVPGDIVELTVGESIPADVVLVKTSELKVNNASLTGESEDQEREPDKKDKNIFESKNVAFFGTSCTNGNGIGVVFKTGDSTVIGQIANLASTAESGETPIAREIDHFIKFVSIIAISAGVFFFIINFIYGYGIVTNIGFMIGIIVANVPEGLLITVTVCMALAAQRMAARRVLVKNLQSVETLGSTTCICSDKTGTLTQNIMTASHMCYDGMVLDVAVNYEKVKKEGAQVEYNVEDPGFQEVVNSIALGSKAYFYYEPSENEIQTYIAKKLGKRVNTVSLANCSKDEIEEAKVALLTAEENLPLQERKAIGDASELGLIKFCQGVKDLKKTRELFPTFQYDMDGKAIDCLIPFSSEIKFNLYIRDMNKNIRKPTRKEDNLMVMLKGGPDRVLPRCNRILVKGEEVPFDDFWKKKVKKANDSFGNIGERVLAFARCYLDPTEYPKEPAYPFDVKNWKKWQDHKEHPGNNVAPGWFPMHNLCLVGLVALNDPPKVNVAYSVSVCRSAGIKVVMVTGDQPPTAAAIALKVNIITDPTLEYNTLIKQGMSQDEAWSKSKALVIHGDLLAERHAAEEGLDDLDPEKGRFLIDWISKPEVVFARTTPSQKLLIVDACQRAGHIVAVTGDGVNDSPAIKKADIGIAMGSGSDVAKNAADILLLDDDFSSIVIGVEQGRVMFDNLKKSIAYALTVNIPQLMPVLFYILFQIPVPLSTILMIVICIGTDMAPAIALAYENGELDIMERMPRNAKRDHLVTAKLVAFSYMQVGIIETMCAMFTYFYVLNDYGIPFTTACFLNQEPGYFPADNDIYQPFDPNYGNTNYGKEKDTIAWGYEDNTKYDIRLFFSFKRRVDWSRCRWDPTDEDVPRWWRIAPYTDRQICYTPEALMYAQGSYFLAVITIQWANVIICKSRNLSLAQQQFVNNVLTFGLLLETSIGVVLSYIWWIGIGLNTRPVACPHFFVPGFCFFAMLLCYDEVRKILVRRGIDKSQKGKIKFRGWFARNTYY